jgi:hypothetical protein
MWDLAEAFFQLPHYFEVRLTVCPATVAASGVKQPKKKGGEGIKAKFSHVRSLEISDVKTPMFISYMPPPIRVETEGF